MKMKKMLMHAAIAFAAAKGAQAFTNAGGIDGVRRKLASQGKGRSSSGGIGGLLGQLGIDDRGSGGSNSLGGLLGGLAGASGGAAGATKMRGLLDTTRPTPEETEEEEQVSGLMLRAMIQAARADGEIDADERAALMEIIGEADAEETAFIQKLMTDPVDADALARDTPPGHQVEVYTAAVVAIEPDNRAEAEFLDRLARGLGLDKRMVNDIHDTQGKPPLYTL